MEYNGDNLMTGTTFFILAFISGIFGMLVAIYAHYDEYKSKRKKPLLHWIAVLSIFAMICSAGLAASNS